MQLNEEQLKAVQHPLGRPACLIAGAGSGKTATIMERLKWLMAEGVSPHRICCITFTNKAAEEIKNRLEPVGEIDVDTAFPHISTIHSLALSYIRRDPEGFGFDSRITPLDDYDQSQMVKKLIERHPPGEGLELNFYRLLEKIRYHRARGIGWHNEYTEEVHEAALESHKGYHAMEPHEVKMWGMFEEEKRRTGSVDFDDMISFVVRRGETDEAWREELQSRFHHVLQDESQDTSPIQWRLINLFLADNNPNLYCVGDLGQSIYSFQGAHPRLLKEFSEGWRGHVPDLYRIGRNHRSLPSVIRLANRINAKMTDTISLKMALFRGLDADGVEVEKGTTRLIQASTPADIALNIAREIQHDSQVKTNHVAFKNNAILVRSATQVRDLEGALVRLRVPYIVRGGRGLLQTEEVKDILAYFRLAVNPKDFTAFIRAIGAPKRGIGDVAIERLNILAKDKYDGDLIQATQGNRNLDVFRYSLEEVMTKLDNPYVAIEKLIRLINYKEYIAKRYAKDGDKVKTKTENVDRFLSLIEALVDDTGLSSEDLIFQLAIDRLAEDDDEEGSVTISTIHSAKGLEWDRVYVTNAVEGSLPHRFSQGSQAEIEEERRLFYVACTRARNSLAICVHSMEFKGPNTQMVKPSRFLREVSIL